ncbi:hypothetical protein SUDANB176_04331 [Streptomyces sp. enrichment culture]|uniref:SCO2521 family protein n=1 Tax=Streptomyces sp. enrichment culture TaxID=1795815 RepID=UPI003F57E931
MNVPTEAAQVVLLGGEVRTCLLPTSRALHRTDVADLLRLRLDERVRVSERPNLYALSPPRLTGVDCALPTDDGTKVRAVGTVVSYASVTEGRVAQVNAYTGVPAAGPDGRRPWAHYLTRPGVVEPLGKLPERAVAQGFLAGSRGAVLDTGLIAEALLTEVLRHPLPDRRAPLRAPRTRLRWMALRAVDADGPRLEHFTLDEDGLRTVELRLPDGVEPRDVAAFCEDLALHDWLLTTLIRLWEDHPPGARPDTAGAVLRSAVDHLLHLWMPGARVGARLAPLWEVLERTPGFTRQWQSLSQRVRDRAPHVPRCRPSP